MPTETDDKLQTVSIAASYHEKLERLIDLTKPSPTKRSFIEHLIDEAVRDKGLDPETLKPSKAGPDRRGV